MKEKKFIIRVFTIIMISAGFLSVTVAATGEPQLVPGIRNLIGFPGGGMVSYDVGQSNGCILNFYYETVEHNGKFKGQRIESKRPGWLVEDKEWVDFGSFTNSQCRQGYIVIKVRIKGTPIEYWGYANGSYYCIGAWDSECPPYGKWYQPCMDVYPQCP